MITRYQLIGVTIQFEQTLLDVACSYKNCLYTEAKVPELSLMLSKYSVLRFKHECRGIMNLDMKLNEFEYETCT